jgi:hypothetical protein
MSIVRQYEANALNDSSAISGNEVRSGFAEAMASGEDNSPAMVPPKTPRLLAASTLAADHLGDDPGNIEEEFKLDLESGRIAYALLSLIAEEILAENASNDHKQHSITRSLPV